MSLTIDDISTAFQFTPLREGRRTFCGRYLYNTGIFQFTPLREGRHYCVGWKNNRKSISIHAPPRGATRARGKRVGGIRISIHAPPRGATSVTSAVGIPPFDFNSRPSARGDAIHQQHARTICISIHAPPRGATHPRETFPASRLFQFTPLREGRLFVASRR